MKMSAMKMSGSLFVFFTILFTFFRGSRPTTIITLNVLCLILTVICFFMWFFSVRCKVKIYFADFLLLGYIIYVIADGLFLTKHPSEAFEYWSLLVAAFAFKLVIQSDMHACRLYIKSAYVSSLIIAVSIVMQAVLPSLINSLQKIVFNDYVYASVRGYSDLGYLTGLSMQNGIAVWFCAILLSYSMGQILTHKRMGYRQFFVICLGILSILLTKKRAILLAAAVASYFLYLAFNRNKVTATFRLLLISLAFVALGVVAYHTIPQFQFMWDKTFHSDRMLSGRETMWEDMIAMYSSAPLIGVGGGTCTYLYGYGGHNCYLQLLGEYGIIGLILFLLAFGLPYLRALFRTKKFLKANRYTKEAECLLTSLFMQTVFFIYCFSGNPVFDYVFFLMEIINIAVAQNVLSGKLSFRKGIDNENFVNNYSCLSGGSVC